ncbi:hypothetical protein FZEAL_8544 [Fusarium zealandicum]|uniref:Uncharacterized protein n=1 Tax=Fusarium zealandicum TaxID=1053134 RepID=A0A8H4XGP6_9HYPO|nr:hypothetical protein FZEAL_8544 [Fusarium zealandicum]
MHLINIFAAATAALATTAAALPSAQKDGNVAFANVVATKGFSKNQTKTPVKIPFGKLTHYNLSIIDLQLKSVTVNVLGTAPSVDQVVCQMYKDEFATQPGSAKFTKANEALISINNVDFGWVLCYVEA